MQGLERAHPELRQYPSLRYLSIHAERMARVFQASPAAH